MSTTKTTKDEAIQVQLALIRLLQNYKWFQKCKLDNDDLGWCLSLYVDVAKMKASGAELPKDIGTVKVCIFNVKLQD